MPGIRTLPNRAPYAPPRRLDQPPRYWGFTPRQFAWAMAGLTLIMASLLLLPQLGIPWDYTFPIALPAAFLCVVWPRRLRDRHWDEGDLIKIRLHRFRKRGRRYAV
jgi:hypothetical protein